MNPSELKLMQLVSSSEAWVQQPVESLRAARALLLGLETTPGMVSVEQRIASKEDIVLAFEQWLRDNGVVGAGADWGVIYMGPEKGNGIVAKKDIKVGGGVMRVPRSVMLSASTEDIQRHASTSSSDSNSSDSRAQYYMALNRLVEQVRDNETLALALALLFQALRPDSFYTSYIRTLPSELSTPLYWSPETFEYVIVTCPDVATRALSSFRAAVGLYIRTLHTLREFDTSSSSSSAAAGADAAAQGVNGYALPLPTWGSFRWALACTTSRQNRIPTKDGSILALVPGWDCLNHDSSVPPSTSFEEDAALEYCAPADYAPGQELHMNYGAQRSNVDLLLYAGFAVAGNPISELQLRIPPLPQDVGKMRRVIFENLSKLSGISAAPASPSSDVMRVIVYPSLQDLSTDLTGDPSAIVATAELGAAFVRGFIYPTTALCVAIASQISKEDIGGLLRLLLALPAVNHSQSLRAFALPSSSAGGSSAKVREVVVIPTSLHNVLTTALSPECRASVKAAMNAIFAASSDTPATANVLASVITVVAERVALESSFKRINDVLME